MSLWIGVMSGTSLDGIDIGIVDFSGDRERPDAWDLVAFRTRPYETELRARIRAAIAEGTARSLCDLDFELGRRIGEAVVASLEESGLAKREIAGIGSHGQTVWHRPPAAGENGATLQLGRASVIAELTGLPVVSDFRTRDMAAGGEGAPLTAYTDDVLFRGSEALAIQNIGGMANVTALPPRAGPGRPLAFDSGPGVALLDAAVERRTRGRLAFDAEGRLARDGSVSEEALADWLADPYLKRPPPKSTGRERFSEERLEAWLARHTSLSDADVAATLTELTARTVADGYRWIPFSLSAVYLCGGGARNPTLAARIGELLAPIPVRDLSRLGLDPEAREAVAFALLGRQHALGIPANAPWATGAAGARLLGCWTPA